MSDPFKKKNKNPWENSRTQAESKADRNRLIFIVSLIACIIYLVALYLLAFTNFFTNLYDHAHAQITAIASSTPATSTPPVVPTLNIALYNQKLQEIANEPIIPAASSTVSGTGSTSSTTVAATAPAPLWPVKTVYPDAGAILPFSRIVAYYGNFYSTSMGVLGKYPAPEMLQMLNATVAQWQAADPSTPVVPGIDYIAVTAQGSPGADGKYRLRMPDSQIEEALGFANEEHGVLILDVQVGLSNVQTEVPLLAKYLEQPNVELALDPEFSMKDGAPPGTEIGTMDATDINFAANYLASLVNEYNLPPKILVVHRFTQDMVTNTQDITPLPQVEIVMDMDGWGSPAKKMTTYRDFIEDEPVQFTGFKLFYVNDLRPPSTGMMTPQQVLQLTPQPMFIQYQ